MTNYSSKNHNYRKYESNDGYFQQEHIEGVGYVKPRKRNWRLFRIVIMVGLLIIALGIRFI